MALSVVKPAPKPAGYSVTARGDRGEMVLYGPIGSYFFDGIGAATFKADLDKLKNVSTIDVRINSDGGDVFEGRTMYSLLAEHKARVVVHVDGLAASIASLIAMSGNEIRMADGAFMMIHNPWGIAVGESSDFRARADLLDTIAETMRGTYAARSKMAAEDIKKIMDAETWLTAQEAKDKGFADVVAEPLRMAAGIRDLVTIDGRKVKASTRFKNLPAALRPRTAALQNRIAAIRG